MPRSKRCFQAFSLAEAVIYTAVLAVVMVGVVGFGLNLTNLSERSFAESELEYGGRFAQGIIAGRIRQADFIDFKASDLSNADSAVVYEDVGQAWEIRLDNGRLILDGATVEYLTPASLTVNEWTADRADTGLKFSLKATLNEQSRLWEWSTAPAAVCAGEKDNICQKK